MYALKLSLPYTAGVPDSWYSGRGGDLWVEYKYFDPDKLPKREIDLIGTKNPIITALQQKWLRDRYAEGRPVAVIVGVGRHGVVYPDLDWQEILPRPEFDARLWGKHQIAAWIAARVSAESCEKMQ